MASHIEGLCWRRAGRPRLLRSLTVIVFGLALVAGAFVAASAMSRSFHTVFSLVNTDVDVAVSAKDGRTTEDGRAAGDRSVRSEWTSGRAPETVPSGLVGRLAAVPGAASVTGYIKVEGAHVLDDDGKPISSVTSPSLGENWRGETGPVRLRAGRGPHADDEVVLNASLATAAGASVGERVTVRVPDRPDQAFTVVGICEYLGGRDTLAGALAVKFHEPAARAMMLGGADGYTSIGVRAAPGFDGERLRDAVRAALGDGYTIETNAQLVAQDTAEVAPVVSGVRWGMLTLAAVVVGLGGFLLYRVLRDAARSGVASPDRRRGPGPDLAGGVVVGLAASTLGVVVGIGLGAGCVRLLDMALRTSLRPPVLTVPAAAVLATFAAGGLVTLLAVLAAGRAGRTLPGS